MKTALCIFLILLCGCSGRWCEREGVVIEQGTTAKAVFDGGRFGRGWHEIPKPYTKVKLSSGKVVTIPAIVGKVDQTIYVDVWEDASNKDK